MVATLSLLLAAFSAGRNSTASTAISRRPATATVVVGAGDTLWRIAARAAPGADPRATIEKILRLNGLHVSSVRPGQRILVPAR